STGPSSSVRSSSCCCSGFRAASSARSPPARRGCGGRGMLEVRDVWKAFDGFQAVAGVSLDVARGEIAAIIGPNGAGKTTFFNLITGPLKPDKGPGRPDRRAITGPAPD